MKKFILMFLIFSCTHSFAQKQLSEYTTQELEQKKKEAESANNVSEISLYKKAIEIRTQIDEAVLAEDYSKAATLKKQLKSLSNGDNEDNDKKTKLEEEIKKAIAAEDYEKANKLKKQLERLKTDKTSSSNNETSLISLPAVEFINQVYFWNKTDNSIRQLEYDTPEMKTQAAGGFGYAQATSFWVIQGVKSDVTLNANENTSFILKVSPGMNPVDMFRLVKFQILGKRVPSRHMAAFTSSSAAYAGSSTKERRDNDVPIIYNKIDDGYYEILINGKLLPGEYTFYGLGKMYSFSVNTSFSNNTSRISNENNTASVNLNSSTNYSKSDIYKDNSITWFGLDFSLFNLTFTKKMGREDEMIKYIGIWQKQYEKEIPPSNLARWLRKPAVNSEKDYSESLYRSNLKQNWISFDYHDISYNEIQNHLTKYKTNGNGIGLVLIPEQFNEDRDNYTVEFVWFDVSSKAIIHNQKISGRAHGGVTQAGWRDALIDATRNYIDQFYKKEKVFK